MAVGCALSTLSKCQRSTLSVSRDCLAQKRTRRPVQGTGALQRACGCAKRGVPQLACTAWRAHAEKKTSCGSFTACNRVGTVWRKVLIRAVPCTSACAWRMAGCTQHAARCMPLGHLACAAHPRCLLACLIVCCSGWRDMLGCCRAQLRAACEPAALPPSAHVDGLTPLHCTARLGNRAACESGGLGLGAL